MSAEFTISKDNLDTYIKELSREFRKLNGTKTPAEIILIGGAAVIVNYGFRDMTNDIDALIFASSVMKEAVNRISDRQGLPNGWLNADFKKTKSFSEKLIGVSKYYKTFSNIVVIRTVAAEYLIAMKLMSGREYKYDLSDIAGILLEHEKNGDLITREKIDKAIIELYGGWDDVPDNSKELINALLTGGDYAKAYKELREREIEGRGAIIEFDKENPGKLKGDMIGEIIKRAREKEKVGDR